MGVSGVVILCHCPVAEVFTALTLGDNLIGPVAFGQSLFLNHFLNFLLSYNAPDLPFVFIFSFSLSLPCTSTLPLTPSFPSPFIFREGQTSCGQQSTMAYQVAARIDTSLMLKLRRQPSRRKRTPKAGSRQSQRQSPLPLLGVYMKAKLHTITYMKRVQLRPIQAPGCQFSLCESL